MTKPRARRGVQYADESAESPRSSSSSPSSPNAAAGLLGEELRPQNVRPFALQ